MMELKNILGEVVAAMDDATIVVAVAPICFICTREHRGNPAVVNFEGPHLMLFFCADCKERGRDLCGSPAVERQIVVRAL